MLDAVAILKLILLLLLFHLELRRAFLRLDAALRSWRRPAPVLSTGDREITTAAFSLGGRQLGALLVMVQKDSVFEMVDGGVSLDARVSTELLQAIFQAESPPRDGAVNIEGDRFMRAGVVLPLTQQRNVRADYGTRHRAGMGLAERCDALVVVVSEERGEVTLMKDRTLRSLAGLMEALALRTTAGRVSALVYGGSSRPT